MDGYLGAGPRRAWIALTDGFYDLREGSLWLNTSMIERWRTVPLFNYTLPFPLQPRKSKEALNQGSREVFDTTHCVEFVKLGAVSTGQLSISPPQLTVGDLRQLLVGTGAFLVAEIRRSTRQPNLSRNLT